MATLQIPKKYIDPITKKIMSQPVMVVNSGIIYDKLTIDKFIENGYMFDPITGISMFLSNDKDAVPLIIHIDDLQHEIQSFVHQNPKLSDNVMNDKSEINWTKLVNKDTHSRIDHFNQEYSLQQQQIEAKGLPLFMKKDDEKSQHIEYNDSVLLSDVPIIISFIGPNRCGKSTLLNDIMCNKPVFEVSNSPDGSCTKGTYISLYVPPRPPIVDEIDEKQKPHDTKFSIMKPSVSISMDATEKKQESISTVPFYLLDTEGLSDGVTQFTKNIFYASYAMSDVMVWNDKEINSDRFKKLMASLKEDMREIAESNRKPAFIYLKRDKNNFYDFSPYDNFSEYIQNNESFQYLRDLNIFSSINGYRIPTRPSPKIPFEKNELQKLIDFILNESKHGHRFVRELKSIPIVVNKINNIGYLSSDLKKILDNDTLKWFMYHDSFAYAKRIKMTMFAAINNWDYTKIERKWTQEIENTEIQRLYDNNCFDKELYGQLVKGKNECIDRIKNKIDYVVASIGKGMSYTAMVTGALAVGLVAFAMVHDLNTGSFKTGEIFKNALKHATSVGHVNPIKYARNQWIGNASWFTGIFTVASAVTGATAGATGGVAYELTRWGWVKANGNQYKRYSIKPAENENESEK